MIIPRLPSPAIALKSLKVASSTVCWMEQTPEYPNRYLSLSSSFLPFFPSADLWTYLYYLSQLMGMSSLKPGILFFFPCKIGKYFLHMKWSEKLKPNCVTSRSNIIFFQLENCNFNIHCAY